MIPIIFDHDFSQPPVGYLDGDGKIKLRKEAGVTPEQLVNVEIGYIPRKVVDGVVVEAELAEISMVFKK